VTRRAGALLAGAAVALTLASPGSAAAAPDRIQLSEWKPLPAASKVKVSPAARALRKRILGPRADDPRYVTLHWVGVSSFIVTMNGHLFLFDAWEIVGVHKDYVPIGREELAGLEPEVILLGHGHFDHAADAGYVAGRSGAPVVASEEQCRTVKEDAASEAGSADFSCLITGTQDTPAMGMQTRVELFEDLGPMTILKHVHSAARPPGGGNELNPFLPVTDPDPYIRHLNVTSPEESARVAGKLNDPEGGTRMYHFEVLDFQLLLGDSSGPIYEHPAIRASLDRLPNCVDVMANAILGFNQPVSGLQDPVLYVADVHPRVYLPTHGDAWAPALAAGQAQYRDELMRRLGELENPPEVDYLLDPGDYVKERAYRIDDPKWVDPMPGSSCRREADARRRRQSCLPRRLAVSGTRVGPARLGRGYRAFAARYRATRRRGRVTGFCVRGGGRFLVGRRRNNRIDLVVTTARGHRTRRLGPGARRGRPGGSRRVSRGLYVGYRRGGGRVLYGLRRNRIRFLAVVRRAQVRRGAPRRALVRRLRRAGLAR
jgi:L-ascorbate metabolism protein UlaG (beta-lactamase superfamily)